MEGNYYQRRFALKGRKALVRVEEYQGEKDILVACTQLDEQAYPAPAKRNKVLQEWIDFFENKPDALETVGLVTRVNQKLFDAVCCQRNLTELYIKGGVFPDISALQNLKKLNLLYLCAGTSTKDISAVGALENLDTLTLSAAGAGAYYPLGNLRKLRQLFLRSGMNNLIKVDSLDFLNNLIDLRHFHTTGFRLLNHDYSPILKLDKLEYLAVNMPANDFKIWNNRLAERFEGIPYNLHRDLAKSFEQ